MKKLIPLIGLAAILAGCKGEARVDIRNNTSRYASGEVAGQTYGVVSGSTTTRSVEVGGFLKSSSKVKIFADVHASWESTSPVVYRLNDEIKMEADHTYTWEIYYASPSGQYILEQKSDEPHSPLLAP